MKKQEVRYYNSFADDFEESTNQNYVLPDDYKWIRTDFLSKFKSGIIYGVAVVFGGLYCRCFLHMRIKGRKNLKGVKSGFFVYGNHTQPVGDVFIPAICVLPKRIYTIVSPANYGIPVIGKILSYLGALPIKNSLQGMRELNNAMKQRIDEGHPIIIYPEAHVWEYYTQIRPFPETSFKYAVKFNKPAYAMTVTYKKAKIFKRPIMEVFLDGPFYPKGESAKSKAVNLKEQIYQAMVERSLTSNVEYIKYKHR